MGMGIKKLVENTGINIICHDHDFHWERGTRYFTPFPEVQKIVEETFPPQIPHARHAVINTYSKEYLRKNYNIDSVLVPNVMDFDQPYGVKDEYNKDLLQALNLEKDDIPLFQVTRILRRKGIETALELVEKLDNKKIKLVITGSAADDDRKGYYKELIETINDKKLNGKVIFADHKIRNDRSQGRNGEKVYSLSDAYAHATACTYFSTYEGFGNTFVEVLLAKKPIFVNNYKPVYWEDIGNKGFKTVMIEDSKLTDKTISEMEKVLYDKKLQKEMADYNYLLGQTNFSYHVLRERLEALFYHI